MYLDVEAYYRAIRHEVKKAMTEIKNDLVQQILYNAKMLPFKKNKVKLAGGEVTSDYERRGALFSSIEGHLEWVESDVLQAVFLSIKENFEESHIGLYYEHGTGDEWDGTMTPVGTNPTPNRYRPGRKIVSRSKFINYAGLGKGRWVDLGGNIRVTGSKEAGRRTPEFVKYVGHDVKAYHWFSRAFDERRSFIMKKIQDAIKSVPLSRYLIVKSKFILGKD